MTKKLVLVSVWVLFFSSLLLFSYVSADNRGTGDSNLIVEVFTDETVYEIDEPIVIYINVTNPTDSPLTLHFSSTLQFDYEIRDNCSNLIYRWSNDKAFAMMVTSITIPAGDSFIKKLPPYSLTEIGNYTVTGIVVGYYPTDTTLVEVSSEIIPEFPSLIILTMFMLATLLTVMVNRRKYPM